ncbi:DUF4231 domain-containing protein [Streptacidiphilus sp. N1-12]|uniref:DUF4231 domain-containing protein n=2 Tax=Streptacidiphilus alkalitolerans TaxID=3342712 RepID=A0ABV6WCB5_9ACTN
MIHKDPPGHRERDLLPEPFWTADDASLQGQERSIRWYRGQILMLVLAALAGTANVRSDHLNWLQAVSAVLFAGAGYFWWRLGRDKPQARWYEGRAAAESVKTLAWKYVVRAWPFAGEPDSPVADEAFLKQMDEVFVAFEESEVIPVGTRPAITAEMRTLRQLPLALRRDLYLQERIRPQRTWYHSRADRCESATATWQLISTATIIIAAAVAVAQFLGLFDLHLLGVCTTVVAAVTAWTQLKQFRPLASAYRLAASELGLIENQLTHFDLQGPMAEELWSRLSSDAEDAVSREHTIWRARRDRRI